MPQNQKNNIKSTDNKYRNIRSTIKTLERKKLNNFNKNLDSYKDRFLQNKLYDLLSEGNVIKIRDLVAYIDDQEAPIREEAQLLKYIVEELHIVDCAQVEKLDSIIRLMLQHPINDSLLEKRCDKILSLIR